MHRRTLRQAAIAGLALFLLVTLGRTVWTEARAVKAQAQLKQAGRHLKGTVIVIDPGHGGWDPGAVVGKTQEKTIVLDISRALKQILEEQGATVILTREEDMHYSKSVREDLTQRVALVAQHKGNVFVSIHANKDPCNCWGAQTFFQRGGLPAGKQLALAIQARLRSLTPTTRGALPADYFVLRTSPVPSAIIETGFLTNAKEHQRLKDPDYQRTLAQAIALGLADYFKSQVPDAKAEVHVGQ